jgi:hypothetical protein
VATVGKARSEVEGRGGPSALSFSGGPPPRSDEQQHHEPDNTGGYRAQHSRRGGARPFEASLRILKKTEERVNASVAGRSTAYSVAGGLRYACR